MFSDRLLSRRADTIQYNIQHKTYNAPYVTKMLFVGAGQWAPVGMDKRGHLPLPLPPPGNVVKCFCALVVTAKRSVDELYMLYFHNLSSASAGFSSDLHRGGWAPSCLGTFVLKPLICPPLKKMMTDCFT